MNENKFNFNTPIQITTDQPSQKLLDAGNLLKRSLEVYKSKFWVLMGINLMPVIAFSIFEAAMSASLVSPSLKFISLGTLIVPTIIISLWGTASLCFAIDRRKEKIGIKKSLKMGWKKLLPYCWVSLLVGLYLMVGAFLLIIPGIIFFIWYAFANYAVISENMKGKKALQRSKELVQERWWGVFERMLLIIFIAALSSIIIELLTAIFSDSLRILLILSGILNPMSKFSTFQFSPYIAEFLNQLIIAPLMIAYSFLLYEDLKNTKKETIGQEIFT